MKNIYNRNEDFYYGLILIFAFAILLMKFHNIPKLTIIQEDFGNYISACNRLPRAINNALEKNKINEGNEKDWEYYLPCAYTFCEKNILKFEDIDTGKKLFMLDGCDWIASKVAIWSLIKNEFGHRANEIMPETFILSDKLDNERFKKYYHYKKSINHKHKFIAKNFKQRQKGLKLLHNLSEINDGIRKDFKVIQDYLENPYTVNGHKINLRYYLLITCYQSRINGYIFDDGFIYYTPKVFEKFSDDDDRNITTGYIDRKIYEENPLTIKEFLSSIGPVTSKILNKEVAHKFSLIMKALSNKICSNKNLDKHFKFQVFGADIAPDEDLKCTLMEINKGPDLGYKDGKDGELKKSMVEDLFKIAESNGDHSNTRFINIW